VTSFESDDPPSNSATPGGRKRPGGSGRSRIKSADFRSSDWYEGAVRRFSISAKRASDISGGGIGHDELLAGEDDSDVPAGPRDGGRR
jgi:hypothetical protein